MHGYVSDTHRRLVELNRLEDESAAGRKPDRSRRDREALIESLRASVSPNVLVQHDRLRARGRRSIAEIRRGVCSACHMTLPVGTLAEAKRLSALLRCDHCGRFVMLADEELHGTPPPVPGGKPDGSRSTKKPAP